MNLFVFLKSPEKIEITIDRLLTGWMTMNQFALRVWTIQWMNYRVNDDEPVLVLEILRKKRRHKSTG